MRSDRLLPLFGACGTVVRPENLANTTQAGDSAASVPSRWGLFRSLWSAQKSNCQVVPLRYIPIRTG